MRPHRALLLPALALAVAATAVGSLGVGAVEIPPHRVWDALTFAEADPVEGTIVRGLRVPRILLGLLVGTGLAAAGTAYQALFRNPLADPYVIGASSGAALGAALAVLLRGTLAGGPLLLPAAAFAGALAAVAVVWSLGGIGGRSSPITLLLAGAAVSTLLGAVVALLMILNDRSLETIFGWLLGGLSDGGWAEVAYGGAMIGVGVVWLQLLARPLDALVLGEETAESLGLGRAHGRLAIVVAATLTTAAAVSVAGVIGFVGLVAPHAARMLFGGRHAVLVPASCLLGALLLLVADALARTVVAPQEIPVGILTALVGGPFFLYLLRNVTRAGEGS